MQKIVDLEIIIDGLLLDDSETVDDFIESIEVNSIYPISYTVLNEEYIER